MQTNLNNGAQTRNRTTDTRIFNPLLYRLSYLGDGALLNRFDPGKSTTFSVGLRGNASFVESLCSRGGELTRKAASRG